MSRFEEAKARLRGVGEDDGSTTAPDDMKEMWLKEKAPEAAGETPIQHHHKDATGCGSSVGFDDPSFGGGDEAGGSGTWQDILEKEGKRKGKPLFQFDSKGKPIVNARIERPDNH